MKAHPEKVTVFDSTNLALHLAGGATLLFTLATGLMLRRGGLGALPLAHAAGALLTLLLLIAHLARFILGWLDKGSDFPLLARASDLGDALKSLFARPRLVSRGYRQRLPYTALAALAPLAGVTGAFTAHPSFSTGHVSAATLTSISHFHVFLGFLILAALLAHLFYSLACPEALWWNPALFSGRQPWDYFARMNPDTAAELLDEPEASKNAETEEKGPGVEEILTQGNLAAKTGDFAGAAAHFRHALELYPGYPQALFNLGASLFKLGDRAGAKEALTQYLEQDAFGAASERARAILKELGEA